MTVAKTTSKSYYPALRGLFGDWVYYSCLMPMEQVTKRVSFASEIHTSKALSDWIQRQLQKGRSEEIGAYLLREDQRFFNSLVIAIHEGDPAWHGFSNLKAQTDDIDIAEVPEEVGASVGLLSFSGEEKMSALDGQHRLAGMREAIAQNPDLGREEVSLLVVAHRKTKAGLERTRRLFTTLNKTARPVGKGETIALDEDDAMAIVTRQLVENDPRFDGRRIKFVQTENISVNDSELTTIGNLYDTLTTIFLGFDVGGKKRGKLQRLRFIRPSDDDLNRYKELAGTFFDGLSGQFPPLAKYFKAKPTSAAAVVAAERREDGGHVLFRPVGLRLFAELVVKVVAGGVPLQKAFAEVGNLPYELSEEPYRNLLWTPGGKMNPGLRPLCRRLLLYMLGRENKVEDLKKKVGRFLGIQTSSVKLPRKI